MKSRIAAAVILLLVAPAAADGPAPADAAALHSAIDGPQRTPRLMARDASRHPEEELSFFGVTPRSSVIEIWPAGGYWTEILAPYLRDAGTYYAAIEGTPADPAEAEGADKRSALFRAKLNGDASLYGRAKVTTLGVGQYDIAPPNTADVVLTFRNLHNWMKDGDVDAVLSAFYRALKPGGVLGIEDHRGQRLTPQDPRALDGYVRQDYAIALAKKAGFVFEGSSEIDANPNDTADWPKGVWTLPPTFALGQQDRAKYEAIGEADNFVLKFRKPGR